MLLFHHTAVPCVAALSGRYGHTEIYCLVEKRKDKYADAVSLIHGTRKILSLRHADQQASL